jgi:hypothetical protein
VRAKLDHAVKAIASVLPNIAENGSQLQFFAGKTWQDWQ